MQRAWPLLLMFASATTVGAQATTDVVPNENLVVDGVPKIPASVAEGVGRYTEFRTAGLGAWHPLRREILITTRFADTNQVHRVRAPGADRTQLTFFPDRVAGVSYEPQRGDFFLFSKDKGGDEFGQLYRYDLATGASTLITDGGRSQNGGVRWSGGATASPTPRPRHCGRAAHLRHGSAQSGRTASSCRRRRRRWRATGSGRRLLLAEGLSASEPALGGRRGERRRRCSRRRTANRPAIPAPSSPRTARASTPARTGARSSIAWPASTSRRASRLR